MHKEFINNNLALLTDLYELTMSEVYFEKNKTEKAVFDAFYRKEALKKGYGIMGGVRNIINFLNDFHFDEEDIEYLRSKGLFSEKFLNYLRDFRFTGNVYAIPDGTPIFGNEPILTVEAPLIEAQLIETIILSYLNAGIMYTTAAKRVSEAAKPIPVMEFGARRALGPDAAIEASACAIIGGCVATSNVLSGKLNDLSISGTFAHSYVMSFDTELEAFKAYADVYPDNCTLLVDTYDVLRSGLPNAIKTAQYLRSKGYELKGIRIDSGDLAYLTKEAKKMLVDAGFPDVKICVSNGLKEETILSLKQQGAVIDSIGLGDNIVLPDNARIGCVYKLVAINKNGKYIAKIKASEDKVKTTTPGFKKVYRLYNQEGFAIADVIALSDEILSTDEITLIDSQNEDNVKTIRDFTIRELQVPIFENGKLVSEIRDVSTIKDYCDKEFATLYDEIKRPLNPQKYYINLSRELLMLKQSLISEINSRNGYGRVRSNKNG
ncbi:MAG: nicotinate phosphoribosyltransferase [Ruminococcus sp.]|nr:nicotinate phosphoribosyltransferase [Ruminococcus sp.]